jgi:hypothetical protein
MGCRHAFGIGHRAKVDLFGKKDIFMGKMIPMGGDASFI